MQVVIDNKKRKEVLKAILKINIKSSGKFVKFCYGFTWFLRILAVILGIANTLYVVFLSKYWVEIIFLILTFGFPFLLSFLPATVYIMSASSEYWLRKNEVVLFAEDEFTYGYSDDALGMFLVFHIPYSDIISTAYEADIKELTISGTINLNVYHNNQLSLTEVVEQLSLLDIYNISIEETVKEKIEEAKKINADNKN